MTGQFNSFQYQEIPKDPNNWREWLFGLSRGWHGLVGENTHRAQAIIDHICSLEEDVAHQSSRRKYWRGRVEEERKRAQHAEELLIHVTTHAADYFGDEWDKFAQQFPDGDCPTHSGESDGDLGDS